MMLRRQLEVQGRDFISPTMSKKNRPHTALITMADPSFQDCALKVIIAARRLSWKDSIFLLTVDFHLFDKRIVEELKGLSVFIVHTNPTFDGWLNKTTYNQENFRSLQATKFRKMEILFNPIFRTLERLIYIDADGVLSSSLEPMVTVNFPESSTILMRQNDRSVRKQSLWGNEIASEMLSDAQNALLVWHYPDREKAGASCWFIVDVKKLAPPSILYLESIEILKNFRSSFKLNDQTLMNILFYDKMKTFPWCSWDEIRILDSSEALQGYCEENMHLQQRLNGDLVFLYRHMSVIEKQKCVRQRG